MIFHCKAENPPRDTKIYLFQYKVIFNSFVYYFLYVTNRKLAGQILAGQSTQIRLNSKGPVTCDESMVEILQVL